MVKKPAIAGTASMTTFWRFWLAVKVKSRVVLSPGERVIDVLVTDQPIFA
jgi:hypothetical protein